VVIEPLGEELLIVLLYADDIIAQVLKDVCDIL
jgi:hypothetical protein